MAIVYTVFANDPDEPLDQLKNEYQQLKSLLEPLEAKGFFNLKMEPFGTLDNISKTLGLFKDDITLFHYAGHASKDGVLLDGDFARIALILAQCPNLDVVFLNGCSTRGQLQLLQLAKIPAVILTSAPVGDLNAYIFSTHFYQQLAIQDKLGTAFDFAEARVLASTDKVVFKRGLDLSKGEADEDLWGIHYLEGREDMEDWRLIAQKLVYDIPKNFIPNQLLLDALLEALAESDPEVKKLKTKKDKGKKLTDKKKRYATLLALPHPISEQLRKLLSSDNGSGDMLLYNEVGLPRLKQMVLVYKTIFKTLCFTLFAQIWDILANEEHKNLELEGTEVIKKYFGLSFEATKELSHFNLFKKLLLLFQKNNLEFHISEFDRFDDLMEEDSNFSLACNFLEKRNLELNTSGISEQDGLSLCPETEEMLAEVLSQIGFFGAYSLTSIKQINLIKYRHQKKPNFNHKILNFIQDFESLADTEVVWTDYLDNASVLLVRRQEDDDEFPLDPLNLSPFFIDLNAFDLKTQLPPQDNLYFLDRFIQEQNAFAYSQIYLQHQKAKIIDDKEEFHEILSEQFDFYSELLFNKPLKSAL